MVVDVMGAYRESQPHPGAVEELTQTAISGWVVASNDARAPRVTLHLDDLQVGSAVADRRRPSDGDVVTYGFRIPLHSLWAYCSPETRITVMSDDGLLPFPGGALSSGPPSCGRSNLEELRRKLAGGFVLNDRGSLQLSLSLDHGWQASAIRLYDRVRHIMEGDFGYDVFVIGGSLLGQVREGDFIGHDHDFDAGYVSRHTNGPSVASEMADIAYTFIAAGLGVKALKTHLHIWDRHETSLKIDLFHWFFDDAKRLRMPFGRAGETEFLRESWDGCETGMLGAHEVLVPRNAELLLSHIYGPDWRIPNPGFRWSGVRKLKVKEAFLSPEVRRRVRWSNNQATRPLSRPSGFARLVRSSMRRSCAVLDIGCGDGRDAFAFARWGLPVLGVDRSHIVVEQVRARARDLDLGTKASFSAVDVASQECLTRAIRNLRRDAPGGRILFYMRFLLDSVPPETQLALLEVIGAEAADGDCLAAEFRSEQGVDSQRSQGNAGNPIGLRPSTTVFAAELTTRYGFTVDYQVESQGLARYRREDPVVCRVLASRGPSGWKPIRSAQTSKASTSLHARLRRKAARAVKATSPHLYDRLRRMAPGSPR